MKTQLEGGADCPDCEVGTLEVKDVSEHCSCHIDPPCYTCVNAPLVCLGCGWEDEKE